MSEVPLKTLTAGLHSPLRSPRGFSGAGSLYELKTRYPCTSYFFLWHIHIAFCEVLEGSRGRPCECLESIRHLCTLPPDYL